MGREDPRAAPRPTDQLDQRRRKEHPGHRQLRGAWTFEDADTTLDELPAGWTGRSDWLCGRTGQATRARRPRTVQGNDRESRRRDWRLARRGVRRIQGEALVRRQAMPKRHDVVREQLGELRKDLEALWVALSADPKKQAR